MNKAKKTQKSVLIQTAQKKKRGRPRKIHVVVVSKNKRTKKGKTLNREIVSDSDSEEAGFSIEYEGKDYLWDKSTDEVFDENGTCVGRKTKKWNCKKLI